MGILKRLQEDLKKTKDIYNDCYTNDKNIYNEMAIGVEDKSGRRRNYLADRLRAQRAIKSQKYDEETVRNAGAGLSNMIRAAAKNAPWYSPNINIADMFDKDAYGQTLYNQTIKHMDIGSVVEEYREYEENASEHGGYVPKVESLYLSCGKEIIDDYIVNMATCSEPYTYVNKNVLEMLRYVTDKLDLKDIQDLYDMSVRKFDVWHGEEKYKPMIKGVMQEYFKTIMMDRDDFVNQYSEKFDQQIAEGKEKSEITPIEDTIISEFFMDNDETKDLEENRQNFVDDLDKFKEKHAEDEKMLMVKPKEKFSFASIKKAVNKILGRNKEER